MKLPLSGIRQPQSPAADLLLQPEPGNRCLVPKVAGRKDTLSGCDSQLTPWSAGDCLPGLMWLRCPNQYPLSQKQCLPFSSKVSLSSDRTRLANFCFLSTLKEKHQPKGLSGRAEAGTLCEDLETSPWNGEYGLRVTSPVSPTLAAQRTQWHVATVSHLYATGQCTSPCIKSTYA